MHRTSTVSWAAARIRDVTQRRVLYVEDDAFAAALVEATLEDAGVAVHWISSGRSALTAAGAEGYDAYLVGVGPRDMSGVTLAENLARFDHRVPIIFIAEGRQNLPLCLNLTVVTRPFAPRALVGAVQAALSRHRVAA